MIILRETQQIPKAWIWYQLNIINKDSDGNILEWEETPTQFSDGQTIYSTTEVLGTTYNPQLVKQKFSELKHRDSLYNEAGMLIKSIIGDAPIYRLDHPPTVVLGISSEYTELYGEQVASALYSAFSDEINSGELTTIWGDI